MNETAKTLFGEGVSAHQFAVRLAGTLSFEALRDMGWRPDELMSLLGAVDGISVEADEMTAGPQLTVQFDDDGEVSKDLLQRFHKENRNLPLFLWMLSARVDDPPEA